MKKLIIIICLISMLAPLHLGAVKAYPRPKTVRQPNGSTLTLVGHGDEFNNYLTTTDGYTVVKGLDGIYRYAVEEGKCLKASSVVACDGKERTSYDSLFLSSVKPHLRLAITPIAQRLKKLSSRQDGLFSPSVVAQRRKSGRAINANGPYRGLVILVNFTDQKFSRGEDSRPFIDDMMNKPNRTSYYDSKLNANIPCTGSVRDYFYDNSGGMFVPEFDVVGPIEVDVNQYYINGITRTYDLCAKVLEKADSQIDFSRYDADGDGQVDMFYLLYAGYASIYQGNDERLVWPHAGHFGDSNIDVVYDGMKFGRFACSSEIYGWQADKDLDLDDIGVIVHEFSHVLGFKDHYDVSGYLNEEPGAWDVMASGNYNGICNDTPCGYNSYEKYAAGFITPRTVEASDHNTTITLRALSSSDDALRIVSLQDSTIFMCENRQLEKWDAGLPGAGMLVWRVDSCNREYWDHNALNVNSKPHFRLVRANGVTANLWREIQDTDYDPFPGTKLVSELTNYTKASHLLSNKNYPSPFNLRNIREEDDLICFEIEADSLADKRPYTFCLDDSYDVNGESLDGNVIGKWEMRSGYAMKSNREVAVIYDLIPDTKNIAATDPKYADGLAAAYSISSNRDKIFIEPYRVALYGDYGVWLVDFNNLDNGGTGAITLNISPYGELSLADPATVLGYCMLPKTAVLVKSKDIVERYGEVKHITFSAATASVIDAVISSSSSISTGDNQIYNLQGMKVSRPIQGEIYIVNGKKIRF